MLLLSFFSAAQGHEDSQDHDYGPLRPGAGPKVLIKRQENATSIDAKGLVAQALAAMGRANKARVENPTYNKHELSKDRKPSAMAPALDYETWPAQSSNSAKSTSPYSIPSELKKAAKKLAESTDQTPKGDHAKVAATTRKKYRHNTNDTNTPPPLKSPYGKLGEWALENQQKPLTQSASGYWMVDMAKRGSSPYAQDGYKVHSFYIALD
jgi:hypothetical protein